jgi:glutaredoxin 3
MKKVTIYTPSDFACPYCKQAKALLTQRGIEFDEIKLSSADDAAWDELQKKSGLQTVPQIFSDGKLIGGYSDLSSLDKKDQLASLK